MSKESLNHAAQQVVKSHPERAREAIDMLYAIAGADSHTAEMAIKVARLVADEGKP